MSRAIRDKVNHTDIPVAGLVDSVALKNEIADMNNVLGAKNLLPNDGVTKTKNGLTFTVNSDRSITVSGVATMETEFIFCDSLSLKDGTNYILTGCPSGGSGAPTYLIQILKFGVGSFNDTGSGKAVAWTSSYNGARVRVLIGNGQDFTTPKTFYPMIRLASIQDATYEPYSMTNREMTPYVQAISNPNLLDNPWFTVNQRGFSSKNDNGFTVDRWKILQAAGTVSLSNGAITIDPTVSGTTFVFGQTIEDALAKLGGKTLTLSVLLSDGIIKSKSFIYPKNVSGGTQLVNVNLGSNHYFEIYTYSSGHARCGYYYYNEGVIPSSPLTIKAVKLEIGSVSTLAMDTAPNYTTELLKCQRYYWRIYNEQTNPAHMGLAIARDNTTMTVILAYPVTMRVKSPTISSSQNALLYSQTGVATGTYATSISGSYSTSYSRGINVNGTGLTVGSVYNVFLKSGAYIDFSADL